jgi:hypothetical protein
MLAALDGTATACGVFRLRIVFCYHQTGTWKFNAYAEVVSVQSRIHYYKHTREQIPDRTTNLGENRWHR